jgi:hypothetical protein
LLAETANDLQTQLDAFYEYCNLWKLKVNADKTKVMVFGNGRLPPIFKTSYIAFSALSARCFFVKLKFPVLVKIIPR